MTTIQIPDSTQPINGDTICGCCGEKYEDGEIYMNPWWSPSNSYGMGKPCILQGIEDWANGIFAPYDSPKNSSILDKEFWLEELGKTERIKKMA